MVLGEVSCLSIHTHMHMRMQIPTYAYMCVYIIAGVYCTTYACVSVLLGIRSSDLSRASHMRRANLFYQYSRLLPLLTTASLCIDGSLSCDALSC